MGAKLPDRVILIICTEPVELDFDYEVPEEEGSDGEGAGAAPKKAAKDDDDDDDDDDEPAAAAADENVADEPPPQLQMIAEARVGDLKDVLNKILGKCLGIPLADVADLPRMRLMTGRKDVGSLSDWTYGSVRIVLDSIDLRDAPRRSAAEELDLERIREKVDKRARETSRTRRARPTKHAGRR